MSQILADWVRDTVLPVKSASPAWQRAEHFNRDPFRPTYTDSNLMFSPADGTILYQLELESDDAPICEIHGTPYSLRDACRRPIGPALVIGIFLTVFDVHINRVPLSGWLSYEPLPALRASNATMAYPENEIFAKRAPNLTQCGYLSRNERMLNTIVATDFTYYVLQIADLEVDAVTPFDVRQHQPVGQGERFSAIRFGSQVDLIIPATDGFQFECLEADGMHVEAGIDPLVRIHSA